MKGVTNQYKPNRLLQSFLAAWTDTDLIMKCAVVAVFGLVCCLLGGISAHSIGMKHKQKAGVVLSPPLGNALHRQRVNELARAAQQLDKDTETRLLNLPKNHTDMTNLFVCCLHVNIIDFYLRNVLNTEEKYPHLTVVKQDLHRISTDLKEQGCAVTHVRNQQYVQKFKEEYIKLGTNGQRKAIGEVDILFEYLSRFCKEKKTQ
ncbi:interleukin-22 [Amia ocellicauda]|uniref:interleukin-22 n=1 Tax=Amia ocellicauda TaxID=2972642 RepID=UPI003464DEDF